MSMWTTALEEVLREEPDVLLESDGLVHDSYYCVPPQAAVELRRVFLGDILDQGLPTCDRCFGQRTR